MRTILSLIAVGLACSACSTTLPPDDTIKLVVTEDAVAKCKYLKDVRGDHNLWGGAAVQIAINDATAQLKNNTAKAGGNTVLVTSSSTHWAGANMAGKAYRC